MIRANLVVDSPSELILDLAALTCLWRLVLVFPEELVTSQSEGCIRGF